MRALDYIPRLTDMQLNGQDYPIAPTPQQYWNGERMVTIEYSKN